MFPTTKKAKVVKAGSMALKVVVLGVSGNIEEWELLEEDLCCINCHGFLEKP